MDRLSILSSTLGALFLFVLIIMLYAGFRFARMTEKERNDLRKQELAKAVNKMEPLSKNSLVILPPYLEYYVSGIVRDKEICDGIYVLSVEIVPTFFDNTRIVCIPVFSTVYESVAVGTNVLIPLSKCNL